MPECRYSGYPGAWCLDCGREDPMELALALGEVYFKCSLDKSDCACQTPDEWLKCENFGPVYKNPLPSMECTEPGSNRFNPYKD
jgi:hypothetical protein